MEVRFKGLGGKSYITLGKGNRINSYEWMTDDSERGEAIGNEEEQGYREGIQRGRTEMEGHLSSRIEA